jgi:hypothetical protein
VNNFDQLWHHITKSKKSFKCFSGSSEQDSQLKFWQINIENFNLVATQHGENQKSIVLQRTENNGEYVSILNNVETIDNENFNREEFKKILRSINILSKIKIFCKD